MKNYGDRGEAGVIRRGRITPSEISIILYMIRKPNSIIVLLFIQNNSQFKKWLKHAYLHRFIDVQFIFDSARLGIFSSTNVRQIADVALRVVFLLFSPCFCYNFPQFLLFKRVKCPTFFVFTTKTTQPRPQIFSVKSALTCKNAALFTSFPR